MTATQAARSHDRHRRRIRRLVAAIPLALLLTACVPMPPSAVAPAPSDPPATAEPQPSEPATTAPAPSDPASGSDDPSTWPAPGEVGSPEQPALVESTDPSNAELDGPYLVKVVDELAGLTEPDSELFMVVFTVRELVDDLDCGEADDDARYVSLTFEVETTPLLVEPFEIAPEMFLAAVDDDEVPAEAPPDGCPAAQPIGPIGPLETSTGTVVLEVPEDTTALILAHPIVPGSGWLYDLD